MFKYKFVAFVALVCLVLSFTTTLAFADSPNSSPVKVQISAYGSNERSQRGLFTTDFIVPLYYPENKNTLFFFNPKYTYTTPDADEINQGIGLRHIFDDSFILGINIFFDRRLAHSGKWYSQAGLGLEYLSHPLDVRLNWYKPLTRPKVVDTTYGFGSTSLIQYDSKEEPLQGLDFEVGVPVFDQYTKTRLYLGGFFYQSRLSKDVNGFRTRTETSLAKWLSLDATFESKSDGQTKLYGGARVILPFEWTKLFRKKSKQESSSPAVPNTYIEDRIFDRVVRDIDIQSKSSTAESKENDLVYVDNSNTSGTEDGSLQHPYNTIQEGVNNAFGDKWVYVKEGLSQESTPTYYAAVDLTSHDDVVLWGSGYDGGFKGITAPGYPVIDGGGSDDDIITLGDKNTIMGLQIQNTGGSCIIATDRTQADITNNIIKKFGYNGVSLANNGAVAANYNINDNIFTNDIDSYDDICIENYGSGLTTANILRNNFENNLVYHLGMEVYAYSTGPVNCVIRDNSFIFSGDNSMGIYGCAFDTSQMDFIITGNSFIFSGDYMTGIYYDAYENSQANYTITGNSYLSTATYSPFTFGGPNNDATLTAVISGNSLTSDMGIDVGSWDNANATYTIFDNTITGYNADTSWLGIEIQSYQTSSLSADVYGNTITGFLHPHTQSGDLDCGAVQIVAGDSVSSSVKLYQNTINNNYLGVHVHNLTTSGVYNVDLGGGTLGSMGYNSIYGNTLDVNNESSGLSVSAQHNWWGQAPPDAAKFSGTVDYTNYLYSNPN
ncbi:MAG: inverse autotransporter beta domain-containing protein [Candidatus Omnitrophota bacterium]